MRQAIKNATEVVTTMQVLAEKDDLAKHVLSEILDCKKEMAPLYFHTLDDMNIRGSQIVVGMKWASGDLDLFLESVLARDAVLIKEINRAGYRGGHDHKAVDFGAHNGRRQTLS